MKVSELCVDNITESVAYMIGLMYPFCKTKEILGSTYVVGSINHNANMITQDDIIKHYQKIGKLMKTHEITSKIEIKANKKKGDYSISTKEGFSLLLQIDGQSFEEILQIFHKLTTQIKDCEQINIKQNFACGCFDGRSSYDKTTGYLSLDVDRDHPRQTLIKEILTSLGISANLNQRDTNHKKNDQIRIDKASVKDFMDKIGLYSVKRTEIIRSAI